MEITKEESTLKKEREEKENKEEVDTNIEDLLDLVRPDAEEYICRRINHLTFARTILWLSIKSKDNNFIQPPDLTDFIKVDEARTRQILNGLVKIGILSKRPVTSNFMEYWFIKEGGFPIVQKYFERAKKSLGIKVKLTLEH